MSKPVIHTNELFQLIHTDQIDQFNRRKSAGESTAGKLSGGDYRGLDLRILEADGLDLSNAYFRGADLRGIDFRKCNIEGASFCQARVSGCYFPDAISADEIRLSVDYGIRVRYRK
jgi:uncharacterized protein YjbI with pentapeptide repeats